MNCETARPMISALYDGENVGAEVARHLSLCEACRETLRDYARMTVNMRLLAAQEIEGMKMQSITRQALLRRNSLIMALLKPFRVPRLAAAICALVIVLLAGGWARTRAQNSAQWFQYRFSLDLGGGNYGSAGGVVQACASGCEHSLSVSGTGHIVAIIGVQKIEGDEVYLTLRVKRFSSAPDMKHLAQEMGDAPPVPYTYKQGQSIEIPVTGGGRAKFDGMIVPSGDGTPEWVGIPAQPDENQVALLNGLLIRDGQVVNEMIGSGSAWGHDADSNAGFYAYLPGQGLLAIALKEIAGALEGTADHGRIRFSDNGVKYILDSGSAVTGGPQPRRVWVLHLADYLPSHHNSQGEDSLAQFGTSSNIEKILRKMGAIQ
jgi:hypothetical protein